MALNAIPQNYDPLVSLAEDAADGAQDYGTDIGLAQNTEAKIRADLWDLAGKSGDPTKPGKQALYVAAKAAKVAGTAARRSAESNARAFCATAVGVLKNFLGTEWNSAWQAVGFTDGSLAIPDDPLPLLGTMRAYFLANGAQENAPLNVTAARCEFHVDGVSDARTNSNASNVAMGNAKAARDASQVVLYKRMSGLLAELRQQLEDDDARWYAFGFDRPADGDGPGPVLNLTLVGGAVGSGMIFADWDDARRAERYRVFKQIVGVDAEPVEVSNAVTESEFTLTGLPSGQTVIVTIVPVNDAGDGPTSDGAQIVGMPPKQSLPSRSGGSCRLPGSGFLKTPRR